ncbi:hypothetical protein CPT_Moabite_228 [Serratia phage Moabite]|uniref:Uncharacterized protein n=1 Tax=Serratia phage Moabite TaxID=2587814 RepID=A0A4Y5TPF9_9CAUD|nr:hypothetical protein HWC48_gp188 [Serratia phage Moabite]QDB71258.1 hypothetical protein CPT_Moabite_228 [Serratia phage Moabite]UGO54112.1 hypothetical protein HAYMO_130 [Serratia phage vB_SmaM_Haymo]
MATYSNTFAVSFEFKDYKSNTRDIYVEHLVMDWGVPKRKLDRMSVRQLKSLYERLKTGYKAKTKTRSAVKQYSRNADVVVMGKYMDTGMTNGLY